MSLERFQLAGSPKCLFRLGVTSVYLFLTTMAHTLDSVLGSGGLRLTFITTFSESFAPWCRLKKETDPGGGERGFSWMTSIESRVSSAAFPKIFTAAKKSLVPSARRRLSQRDQRVLNPFHDTFFPFLLANRLRRYYTKRR